MKIVIDLDEVYYEGIMKDRVLDTSILKIFDSIKNGTILPKGHGDLKDADTMINKLCTNEASELFGSTTCAEILDFINSEKTIIEADKAESEE